MQTAVQGLSVFALLLSLYALWKSRRTHPFDRCRIAHAADCDGECVEGPTYRTICASCGYTHGEHAANCAMTTAPQVREWREVEPRTLSAAHRYEADRMVAYSKLYHYMNDIAGCCEWGCQSDDGPQCIRCRAKALLREVPEP